MKTIKVSDFFMIEADIFLNRKLSSTDKILYGLINALNQNGPCYARTNHLMKIMNLSRRQIQKSLSKLKEFNYIDVRIENNNKRYIITTLHKFIEDRQQSNESTQLFDYNWLEDN